MELRGLVQSASNGAEKLVMHGFLLHQEMLDSLRMLSQEQGESMPPATLRQGRTDREDPKAKLYPRGCLSKGLVFEGTHKV